MMLIAFLILPDELNENRLPNLRLEKQRPDIKGKRLKALTSMDCGPEKANH